ncbi:SDR family oxidoreductase [Streptomyces sp. TP-A0874]|uniref:SDR family oxidoreductase n=1 Tax=Streptomyces sp. TP-A0874 TaxID=549819 RepID=UPI000AA3AF05|nr:NAD(P)H-binding protein [Streptomyces sp. TP-A0874]
MRIAVVGGTGTLGRQVAEELGRRGHEVRALSRGAREFPIDLRTGEGLPEALEGCDAVVDASNASSATRAAETLVEGSKRLLTAERTAGVRHHVCVSIVGCDQAGLAYYRVKTEQERVVEQEPVPWTIVRATQFHELVDALFTTAARWRVIPVPRVPLQTVRSAEAARAVADIAEGTALRERVQVAGPEITELPELARSWRSITGRRVLLLPLPLPGRLGRALRRGALTAEQPDTHGSTTFGTWLAAAHGRSRK